MTILVRVDGEIEGLTLIENGILGLRLEMNVGLTVVVMVVAEPLRGRDCGDYCEE